MAAISQSYATVQEYRVVVENSDPNDHITIAGQLVAASRVFERENGQFYGRDEAAVVRIFKAKWTDRLDLDYEGRCPGIAASKVADVWTAPTVTIKVDEDGDGIFTDETAWAATDYQLWPLQALMGPEPRPFDCIKTPEWGTKSFRPGRMVQVTAPFGWPAVPEAVKAEVIKLCAIWRNEGSRTSTEEALSGAVMENSLLKRWRNAYRARVTF